MIRSFLVFLSEASGILIIMIDLIFAIWAGLEKNWYIYILNFVLLFATSSMINNSYIQGLTRGFSYIYLFKSRGIPKAIGITLFNISFLAMAFLLANIVFSSFNQMVLYFIICFVLSTIVIFVDDIFAQAIERTKMFENIN